MWTSSSTSAMRNRADEAGPDAVLSPTQLCFPARMSGDLFDERFAKRLATFERKAAR